MPALPHGAAATAPMGSSPPRLTRRVAGQKFHQVLGHADRPHARSAAAVRNAEGLVQVDMANVRADVRRTAESDLGVHVRAVHIDLAAAVVDNFADLHDALLEDAVGGGISDHEGGEIGRVRLGLGPQIRQVNVALRVAGHGDDVQSGHGGAGRVGAVGGSGNEADVAGGLAARFLVFADNEQAGVFALRAGVGLERNAGKTADLAPATPRVAGKWPASRASARTGAKG